MDSTVHRAFNLNKEPFLSVETARTAKLILERTPHLISSPSEEPGAWNIGKGQITGEKSFKVDLFPLTMKFVGDIATITSMGKAFVDDNPGIIEDFWAFDAGFNAVLLGLPTMRLRETRAARARINGAMNELNHAVLAVMNGKDTGHKWGVCLMGNCCLYVTFSAFTHTEMGKVWEAKIADVSHQDEASYQQRRVCIWTYACGRIQRIVSCSVRPKTLSLKPRTFKTTQNRLFLSICSGNMLGKEYADCSVI
jgi:hypothetical protein